MSVDNSPERRYALPLLLIGLAFFGFSQIPGLLVLVFVMGYYAAATAALLLGVFWIDDALARIDQKHRP